MGFFGRAWNLGRGVARVLTRSDEHGGADDAIERELARADRPRRPAHEVERLARELRAVVGAPMAGETLVAASRADRLERLDRAFAEGRIPRGDYLRHRADLDNEADAVEAPDGTPEVRRTL